jgi:hypothetical protein
MASGDTLCVFSALANQPPTTAFATLDTRGAAAATYFVLDFDASTDESAMFVGVLPRNYASGGLTVTLHWMATSATSGDCVWLAAIGRLNTDLDSDPHAATQTATGTANGTSGIITSTAITFTDGAQMDSLAVGEAFSLKITRNADDGSDTMAGDAELVAVEIKET